ncbi:MAG: hypothetical protein R2867_47130 [Caldilineaceae bacterium]
MSNETEFPVDAATVAGKTPYDQQWLGSILRPALIAVLIGCLDIAILSMLLRLYPALSGGYTQSIVGISLLAVLLACATTTWLAQPEKRHLRRPIFRLAEFAFVIVLARILVWVTVGPFPTLTALLYRPLEGLFDGPFIFAAIVIGLSWIFAGELTSDLLRLALQPDELFAIEEDRIGELVRTSNSDRPAILQRLVSRWVGGGILLVLIAASVRIERPDVGFLAITRQNIDPTIIAAVVIYFLAGLLLISQGQLAILRTRWLIDRVPASEQVLGQWPIYVIGLLVGIGLLAGLLPFGGTFLLAQVLYAIVSFFFNAIFSIFRFFMGLLLLIIAMLSGEAPETPLEAPTPEAAPPPLQEMLPPTSTLPEWTGGAIFWVVMTLFLCYAAYIYLNDKGVQFTWLRAFWQLLQARWRALFGSYQQWQRARVRHVDDAVDEEPSGRRSRWGWRRGWQHLDPTQRVRYFYLTMVEQAAVSGVKRAVAETPLQFAGRLGAHLSQEPEPSADPSTNSAETTVGPTASPAESSLYTTHVNTLTNAFVQTRYRNSVMAAKEASQLEELWKKLSTRLQRKRHDRT